MTQPVWKERLDELLEEYKDQFNWCREDDAELIDLLLADRANLEDNLISSIGETDRLRKWCLMLTPNPVDIRRASQLEEAVSELVRDFKYSEQIVDHSSPLYRLCVLMENNNDRC